jgi:hypothetical protein
MGVFRCLGVERWSVGIIRVKSFQLKSLETHPPTPSLKKRGGDK